MAKFKFNRSQIEWARNLFSMLEEGGSWGIPRSAMVFVKRGQTLVLMQQLHWDPISGVTRAEWEEGQTIEFEGTKALFAHISVKVLRDPLAKTQGNA